MNLIEQLGGYDAAKGFYERATKYGFKLIEIRDALLEHRRQHTIFEMGDYIIHDGELKVFAMWSTAIEGCAYIGYAYAEDGEMADKDEFRHATDAEIAAGHRLPTCEVLDEADIPTTAIILEQPNGKQE